MPALEGDSNACVVPEEADVGRRDRRLALVALLTKLRPHLINNDDGVLLAVEPLPYLP